MADYQSSYVEAIWIKCIYLSISTFGMSILMMNEEGKKYDNRNLCVFVIIALQRKSMSFAMNAIYHQSIGSEYSCFLTLFFLLFDRFLFADTLHTL